MPDKEIKEYEDEVFIYGTDEDESKSLVIVGKNGDMFSLIAQMYCGKITEEKKKEMKSIGIFSVYD